MERAFQRRIAGFAGIAAALMLSPLAFAAQPYQAETQPAPAPAPEKEGKVEATAKTAGKIATQPARDVGAVKTKIPPALQKARDAPYSLDGITTCEDIGNAAQELSDVLGPDFAAGNIKKENRTGKLAEAGGKTIVNALIPFRGLVREISGAGPAQRRLNAAIDAGYARRGFLRGIHQSRGCTTALENPPVEPDK